MAGDRDFERRLELIERGVHEIEAADRSGVARDRAAAGAGGDGAPRHVPGAAARDRSRLGSAGPAIIDQLGRDPLVSHLLLLHSLHPLTLEARVRQALETVRPVLRAKQARGRAGRIAEGVVRLRLLGGPGDKAAVERAILDVAPDVAAIEVEGAVETVVGFVPLGSVRRSPVHAGSQRAVL